MLPMQPALAIRGFIIRDFDLKNRRETRENCFLESFLACFRLKIGVLVFAEGNF
jgi:hypothetical protein